MNKKESKGITLVALVITIIVLIILAGVSINAVMNGGLIGNAKNARDEFNKAKQDEEVKLSNLEADMEDFNIQTPYKLKNGFITGVIVNKTSAESVESFANKLPKGYTVVNPDNSTIEDITVPVRCGMNVKNEKNEQVGIIILYGDVSQIIDNTSNYIDYNATDGKINANDVGMLKILINRDRELEDGIKIASDVNHDGIINWKDASNINRLSRIVNWNTNTFFIDQNVYAINPDTITIENDEQSKQKWVNILEGTIKAKFEWQEGTEEENNDGYYILKINSGETVGALLQKLNKKVVIVSNTTGNILESTDSISASDKIMLYPDFEATDTRYMLELGTIQIVE